MIRLNKVTLTTLSKTCGCMPQRMLKALLEVALAIVGGEQ
jgi:hypothetical protein